RPPLVEQIPVVEPVPMARPYATREVADALRLLEPTSTHRSAPAIAIGRTPVVLAAPARCGGNAIRELLRPRAGVGNAAEAANVMVHPRRIGAHGHVPAGPGGYSCAMLAKDRAGPLQLRPGFRRVSQYGTDDFSVDGAIALDHPLSWFAIRVVALKVRSGGETSGVKGVCHSVRVRTVEFDLDAKGLVWIG